ncbi:MAG: hypothetical protein GIX02_00855 [Candidatus Eremiobacteraeota bacterium]|nr:hypothetical protein [Candidatus Eremiobacteraeota bacterium]
MNEPSPWPFALRAIVIVTAALMLFGTDAAWAGTTGAPQTSASPVPRGVIFHAALNVLFLSQGASGRGLQPVEGPAFATGAPAAPVSPYDVFSGAPMVPGIVGQTQLSVDGAYRFGDANIGVTFAAESLLGDRTNEAYWAEPLLPEDNPHLGSQATGLSIVFPTHPGSDDYNGVRAGISRARISLDRDRLVARIGWIDLKQTLAFVFSPPPTTNSLPGLLLKTPESMNPNSAALDAWDSPPATLHIRGIDAAYLSGSTTIEASDAQLPSLPGTPARLLSFSLGHFDDAGHGAMFQAIAANSGGDPIGTTTGFGVPSQIVPSDQGLFAVSTLHGQHQAIAGLRIARAVPLGLDGALEYAHSTYRADGLGKPETVGGSWENVSLAHGLGAATVTAHYYRFEPTFATMILPYGVPENVWSVAYSWPGPWLKSTYQLVDNTALGVNRQGPSLSYSLNAKSLHAAASYSTFRQIAPFTTANFRGLGFIDGFFLVQPNAAHASLGSYRRTAFFIGKQLAIGDIGVDFVDDGLHRDSAPSEPFDAVSYDVSQTVVSWSRKFRDRARLAAGAAYYGMRGSFADGPATNIDAGMHVFYAGAQFQESKRQLLMATVRRSTMSGEPYFGALGAVRYGSPDFNATTLLLEQRFRL